MKPLATAPFAAAALTLAGCSDHVARHTEEAGNAIAADAERAADNARATFRDR